MDVKDGKTTLFPNGHFYSPVVDTDELRARAEELWHRREELLPGIDFNLPAQRYVLEHVFPRHFPKFDYVAQQKDAIDAGGRQTYFIDNDQFSHIDAAALFVLLCELQPRRIVEAGSGFSTLLMVDVRNRFLAPGARIECIEPYPREFLLDPTYGISLVQKKIQDVPLSYFESIEAGDFLFIDTSHVCKTGSDVNYLFLKILPRLRPGVYVHVHDIFLPEEYPFRWVIEENRSWNEQYLLQAFLINNPKVKVLFGSGFARVMLTQQARDAVQGRVEIHGGSFWFQTIGDKSDGAFSTSSALQGAVPSEHEPA
ncbi:MAG: class I SAM-dependent methyltransferase [Lysobacter sp.]|nr:class I SAM-dependent methyltransferase [Lysobacter sp.]